MRLKGCDTMNLNLDCNNSSEEGKRLHYFESHCHPDHPLITEPHNYVNDALHAGIEYLLVAPITYESNFASMELYPKDRFSKVLFAKGLHPKYAYNISFWNEKEIEEFKALVESDDRIVAFKSGIDLCKKNLQAHQIERQFAFLQFFHDLAYTYKKPLVLHIREAAEEALEYLEKNPLLVPAEVHCFAYDSETMYRFIRAGVAYFGIGGMITRPENEALREAVAEMPLERILLESDSPFVKVWGDTEKINTSAKAIPAVAKAIAGIKGISVEKVVEQTYLNACEFFGV